MRVWLVVTACAACGHTSPITARALAARNPTSLTFEVAPAQVDACWDHYARTHERMTVRTDEDARSVPGGEPSLSVLRRGAHDALLVAFFPLGRSEVYVDAEGRGLPYEADFAVHVVPLGPAATRIEVTAVRSKVMTGTEPAIGHAWEQYVFEDVPPTTIDEYRVLRCLADCLGVKDGLPAVASPVPAREADLDAPCRLVR